jgi:hypothetical protein
VDQGWPACEPGREALKLRIGVDVLAESPDTDFRFSLPIPAFLGMREAPSDSGLIYATRRGVDLGRVRG